jgi:hypothetical protein
MQLLELFVISCIMVISFGLLLLSLLAYKNNKSLKMLFISFVFLVFFIKVVIYNISLYISDINLFDSMINIWIFDLVILVLLYIASMKR